MAANVKATLAERLSSSSSKTISSMILSESKERFFALENCSCNALLLWPGSTALPWSIILKYRTSSSDGSELVNDIVRGISKRHWKYALARVICVESKIRGVSDVWTCRCGSECQICPLLNMIETRANERAVGSTVERTVKRTDGRAVGRTVGRSQMISKQSVGRSDGRTVGRNMFKQSQLISKWRPNDDQILSKRCPNDVQMLVKVYVKFHRTWVPA